jgi:N-acyl homoserine lactone hydrolase
VPPESIEVVRLYLGSVDGPLGPGTPFHGFAIKHPQGVVLVDTGMGTPPQGFNPEWKLVLRSVADALADHDLSPADVKFVVNTHLNSDHCGENIVFKHTPFILQREELERGRREEQRILDRFDFVGAKFELLDGDAEILPGLHAIFTPGHTSGHQSVLIEGESRQLIVGDAAYTADIWDRPETMTEEHPAWKLQVHTPLDVWQASLEKLASLKADRMHFCHDPRILDG